MLSHLIVASLAGYVQLSTAAVLQPRAASPAAYCSNSDLSLALSSISAPVQGTGTPGSSSTWQLSIDDTSSGHKQQITGFGAAVTDATVSSLNSLSASARDAVLSQLVTTSGSKGAGFSLMRHTIGSSDLSGDPAYSYDDNGGNVDTSLSGFNLGDRGTSMAKLLASMTSKQSLLEILGSPWSAPGWMKINKVLDGTTTNNNLNDKYVSQSTADYSSAFASYFVKYIQAFKKLGANIGAITIQNEPLNSQSGYPTMYVYDSESATLIQNHVGPALASAGLGSTQIWAYDHNTDVPSYPQTVLNNAGQYVSSVAWHCYASSLDWTVLSRFQSSNPGVSQYMTECWTPGNSWNEAADFTLGPLQNWAKGVIAWTLATDANDGPHLSSGGCTNCKGLITVNGDGSVTYNSAFYMLAQFSRFMPRGATVLSGTGSAQYGNGGIQSVATLNPDGSRTVVMENTYPNDIYLTLTTKSGQKWSGNLPMQSLTTWVLPPV